MDKYDSSNQNQDCCLSTYGNLARHFPSLASQMLFPVLMGMAGNATGKKGLVSLGHIPWHLQECRQIQWNPSCHMTPPKVFNFLKAIGTCRELLVCVQAKLCVQDTYYQYWMNRSSHLCVPEAVRLQRAKKTPELALHHFIEGNDFFVSHLLEAASLSVTGCSKLPSTLYVRGGRTSSKRTW